MQQLYPDPPMLFTVDPYGQKPYPEGEVDKTEYVYGDDFYVQAKRLLSGFSNHAHFLMTGEDFIGRVLGTTYWRGGKQLPLTGFALAFLDGDHSSVVIDTVKGLTPHMLLNGLILVDNADWNGNIVEQLLQPSLELVIYTGRACLLRKR